MKKIYTTLAILGLAGAMTAQQSNRVGLPNPGVPVAINPNVHTQAIGDSLLFTDAEYWYVNPTDAPTFTIATEDIDGLALASGYASAGYSQSWGVFYSLLTDGSTFDFHEAYEAPTDTAFTLYAVSWFSSPAQADNWLEFGPITIPATGAHIAWTEKCNPAYRDGYSVLLSTTGMANYTDFTNPAIYTRADAYPSPTEAMDTIWQLKTVDIPASMNGMPIYFAYHHTAFDMDVLYIDDINVIEGPLGVASASSELSIGQNYPNPANASTTISYSLTKNSDVVFNVYNATGALVYTENMNNSAAGSHKFDLNTSNYANGLYSYTFTVNGMNYTRKFSVQN
ncbi:MAG: T9SS type A sorting domain-containing protein [Bacteroidetes bacterium]|nr:T9SS type A sorting domain-containing protein [Bacteroidota bacterium]